MRSIILALFVPLSLLGQEYLPFPLEGASWTNGYYQLVPVGDDGFYVYELQVTTTFETTGDTLISGTLYTKVISENPYFIENVFGDYIAAIRENEGRVFVIPAGNEIEKVLYDFTLEAGETIEVFNLSNPFNTSLMEVLTTSYDDFNGISRKVIEFDAGKWIEGIGNDRGIFWGVSGNVSDYWTYLECLKVDGAATFTTTDGQQGCLLAASSNLISQRISIFPNPASSFIEIDGLTQVSTIELIDLHGKTLLSQKTSDLKVAMRLTLGELTRGLFLLRIYSEDTVSSHRIILE